MSKKYLLAVSFLICLGIFVSSLRFADKTLETESELAPDALTYEAYSVGINTVLYDINGQINYTLQADRQTQFTNDTTLLEKPFIRLYQQGSPSWNVVAETGTLRKPANLDIEESRSMLLNGHVEVYSVNEFGNRTTMTTDSLNVNFDKEQLSTQEPVRVETEVISQTSIGMFADLATDEIIFHQDIQGKYEHENPN